MSGVHPAATRPPAKPGLLARLPSFVLGTLTKNLPAKLAALLLALIVWFTVRQDLNETFVAKKCLLKREAEKGLVWVDEPPETLEVTFTGPRSQIAAVKKLPALTLVLRESQLVGQTEARLPFSVEEGNLRHDYGDEIEIESVKEGTLHLMVAVTKEKQVRVLAPKLSGVPEDWQERIEVLTPEVLLAGPPSTLDKIAEVQPDPVNVAGYFRGRLTGETVGPIPLSLDLPERFAGMRVSVAERTTLRFELVFPPNLTREPLVVPIVVRWSRVDSRIVVLKEDEQVKKAEEGFEIELEFEGTPDSLERLRQVIERKELTAYVLMTDSPVYRSGATGPDFIAPAYLKVEGRPSGVKKFPPSQDIAVDVIERPR